MAINIIFCLFYLLFYLIIIPVLVYFISKNLATLDKRLPFAANRSKRFPTGFRNFSAPQAFTTPSTIFCTGLPDFS
jgi:hypothetical protein